MLAVYFTLKCFAKDFSNLTVIIHIDNTTVISILKNMGTSHNKLLNKKCTGNGDGVNLRTSSYSQFM